MKRQWRLKTTFWLDVTLLVSVCVLQTVRFTGLVLDEWLGLAIVGMVLAHLLLSWGRVTTQSRRLFAEQSVRARQQPAQSISSSSITSRSRRRTNSKASGYAPLNHAIQFRH